MLRIYDSLWVGISIRLCTLVLRVDFQGSTFLFVNKILDEEKNGYVARDQLLYAL